MESVTDAGWELKGGGARRKEPGNRIEKRDSIFKKNEKTSSMLEREKAQRERTNGEGEKRKMGRAEEATEGAGARWETKERSTDRMGERARQRRSQLEGHRRARTEAGYYIRACQSEGGGYERERGKGGPTR